MATDGGVEVELKFRTDDAERLRSAIRELGGHAEPTIDQTDVYYAHPTRDFAKTDEALRVRIVGETGCVTYKGPLLDPVTKSREETELWFAGGASDANRFGEVLCRLGFSRVRAVVKRREPWALVWQGLPVEIVFDEVAGLGRFVELETAASPNTFETAKTGLLDLAEHLELDESERRSYLSLLLASDKEPRDATA